MGSYFTDIAVMLCSFLPFFFLSMFVLWRLRARGPWTLVLGFVFEIAFLLLGYAIAPAALHSRPHGPAPVEQGIALGCTTPVPLMLLYHLGQARQNRKR